MKLIGKIMATGLVGAAVAVAACSSGPHGSTGGTAPSQSQGDGTGQVGMNLTLPGGEHITTVTYSLTNGAHTLNGSYNITNTATLSFVIGSVPAGANYTLTLSATTDDGTVTCSYPAVGDANTATFTVVDRTTTIVNVNMQCVNNQGLDSGSVTVNATQSNCPVWNTIVANPLNITLDGGANVNSSGTLGATAVYPGTTPVTAVIQDGQSLVLVGAGTFPNAGAVAFNWSVAPTGASLSSTGGTIDPNSTDAGTTDQTVFTCPSSGATQTFTVTLALSDGPVPEGGACDGKFTTGQVNVTCSNPGICGGAPYALTSGGACNNSSNGTPPATDSNGYPFVTNGTTGLLLDGGTAFCCSGACNDTGPIASPFPTGTCPLSDAGTQLLNSAGCCVPLLPCTSAAQVAAGQCVQCGGSTGGVCTATEAILVQRDINHGVVTTATTLAPSATDSPTTSCYACVVSNGGLDDAFFTLDTGHECADVTGSATLNGITGTAACLATLQCIVTQACDTADPPSQCFCGTAAGTACLTAGAANGPCLAQEVNGLDIGTFTPPSTFTEGDPTATQKAYTSTTLGSGQANTLMGFAQKNCPTQCTP